VSRGSVSEPRTHGATDERVGIWEPGNPAPPPRASQDSSFPVFRPAARWVRRPRRAGAGGSLAPGPARTRSGRAGHARRAGMAPHGPRPRVPCVARDAISVGAHANAHESALEKERPRSLRRRSERGRETSAGGSRSTRQRHPIAKRPQSWTIQLPWRLPCARFVGRPLVVASPRGRVASAPARRLYVWLTGSLVMR
jgi:hypothetical protein